MKRRIAIAILAGLQTIGTLNAQEKADVAGATKQVQTSLKRYGAQGGQIKHVDDKIVASSLPNQQVFAVLFRQFPVARAVPKPLKYANLIFVQGKDTVTLVNTPADLQRYARRRLAVPKNDDELKNAARAYVRLAQELYQDGFYQFKLMDDSTKIMPTAAGKSVQAKVVVMKGGNGEINVTLNFGADNKPGRISQKATLRPGPRPRCHATKLLDRDPIVRAIVEQDLLIMGRAAKPYLDEQRAKASPELKAAIDRTWQRILETDK